MRVIFLIFIVFITTIFANSSEKKNILNLTPIDIKFIKASPKKNEIIKRIKNYKELKEDIQKNKNSYSNFKQLSRINSFFNNILPKADEVATNTPDSWATRKEFILKGYGDCEDYAISKYFTLKELQFSSHQLYMMVVKVEGSKTLHMVLGYFKTKNSIPLILDNLSFKVVPLSKRKDLEVKFIFNEFGSYLMENNKISKKVNIDWGDTNKWEDLLKRVYKENR